MWHFLGQEPMHKTNATKEIPAQDRIFNFALKKFLQENDKLLLSVMLNLLTFGYYVIYSLFWSSP